MTPPICLTVLLREREQKLVAGKVPTTVENGVVLRALGDIARRDVRTHYTLRLMRERVAIVGEEREGPVARLLAEFEA